MGLEDMVARAAHDHAAGRERRGCLHSLVRELQHNGLFRSERDILKNFALHEASRYSFMGIWEAGMELLQAYI
jgi:hypothetical protein